MSFSAPALTTTGGHCCRREQSRKVLPKVQPLIEAREFVQLQMKIAFVGCGYVAEFYAKNALVNYPELELVGAYDINERNLQAFCDRWSTRRYESLNLLLEDRSVELILNLTNPRSHFGITKRCLEAGKHVYSEKPLAMEAAQARELVELAKSNSLYLASAPCSLLSETAQTVWAALREGAIGHVRLVYANFV